MSYKTVRSGGSKDVSFKRSGVSKDLSFKSKVSNAPDNNEMFNNNSISKSFGLLHKKEDLSMKSEDKFLSSDMYKKQSTDRD